MNIDGILIASFTACILIDSTFVMSFKHALHMKTAPAQNTSFSWDGKDFKLGYRERTSFKLRRAPIPTIGQPWPKPRSMEMSEESLCQINPTSFKIQATNMSCFVLQEAIKRYRKLLFDFKSREMYDNIYNLKNAHFRKRTRRAFAKMFKSVVAIDTANVKVDKSCSDYPGLSSSEAYAVRVNSEGVFIDASEVWGALRGLETLSQLIFTYEGEYYLRRVVIEDQPRFPHRGLMLDTARHFMHKSVIFQILDGMVMDKFNVFHWHIVDDQSFPFESKVFPNLTEKGAFHPNLVYTPKDVKQIIEYARLRGIRVIPEFDTPAHVYSWGYGYPELLTQCSSKNGPIPAYLGPMDPSKNFTFSFLSKLYDEIFDLFKDNFFHIGLDEVPLDCWKSNSDIQHFLSEFHIYFPQFNSLMPRGSTSVLLDYFVQRLVGDLIKKGQKREGGAGFIFWEEAVDFNIPSNSIIQLWLGNSKTVQVAKKRGLKLILSTCWYLDQITYGINWPQYYNCEPYERVQKGTEHLLIGGEVCLWSEHVTSDIAISTIWPRASAAAERLWSQQQVRDVDEAGPRLEEHRCRMIRRGLRAGSASGPNYCLLTPMKSRQDDEDADSVAMNFAKDSWIDSEFPLYKFKFTPGYNVMVYITLILPIVSMVIIIRVLGKRRLISYVRRIW